MTPYLLAVWLWTLGWVGCAWWLRRHVWRRYVRASQWLDNYFPGPWGTDDDLAD